MVNRCHEAHTKKIILMVLSVAVRHKKCIKFITTHQFSIFYNRRCHRYELRAGVMELWGGFD